jgi:hypothetical protein
MPLLHYCKINYVKHRNKRFIILVSGPLNNEASLRKAKQLEAEKTLEEDSTSAQAIAKRRVAHAAAVAVSSNFVIF